MTSWAHSPHVTAQACPLRIVLASSNMGKLREYREMADGTGVDVDLLAHFADLPAFDESAPTFAENAVGKALHYSRFCSELVLADDSGLVVPALGGAPGVRSARYAGPGATDADRYRKLLREMDSREGDERRARFVCVISVAQRGKASLVVSDRADGLLTTEPRGDRGFGYDPIFFFPELSRTYAELSAAEKNTYSHRGKAFRKALKLLTNVTSSL
ncbi:MAG TPA: RdgB/HAM1 family non-canonical purine NTP pyrophosphatase [Candidatus Acidoferrum sp.]|nr:RdgB/HAM1 family non-canonical purine NTP pyrophosphatase [Candidatus Acidoferrum sp.]